MFKNTSNVGFLETDVTKEEEVSAMAKVSASSVSLSPAILHLLLAYRLHSNNSVKSMQQS